jgi:NAD(P)-dependent dehydrogenase (short-subunit alcohol dehydrogenase family)
VSDFSGKVVIITGGGLGIGRGAAKKLAEKGASVAICSDREDQIKIAEAGL